MGQEFTSLTLCLYSANRPFPGSGHVTYPPLNSIPSILWIPEIERIGTKYVELPALRSVALEMIKLGSSSNLRNIKRICMVSLAIQQLFPYKSSYHFQYLPGIKFRVSIGQHKRKGKLVITESSLYYVTSLEMERTLATLLKIEPIFSRSFVNTLFAVTSHDLCWGNIK